mgnify:CR=1 FL=1
MVIAVARWCRGMKKLAALFSGGKDSTYAIYCLEKRGYRVEYLLTVYPRSANSLYFHYPNIHLTRLQSEAMRRKHIIEESSNNELEALRRIIEKVSQSVSGIVSGVSSSSFQKKAIENICREYSIEVVTPLWGLDPGKLLRDILGSGFEVMITGVAALGLTKDWLGKILTLRDIDKLEEISSRYGVNIVGEGGEMETIVLDCPLFKERLEVLDYEVLWEEDRGFFMIKSAILRSKG